MSECCQQSHVRVSFDLAEYTGNITGLGTTRILEACRKYNPEVKIIFAGTRGQYGKPDYLPMDEKHLMHPTDVNGINNIAGEWYHILYNNVYGIKTCSLRLTNTYGPRHQMKHHRQGIINWFIRQIMDGTKVKIFGDGKQIRDTDYIADIINKFN